MMTILCCFADIKTFLVFTNSIEDIKKLKNDDMFYYVSVYIVSRLHASKPGEFVTTDRGIFVLIEDSLKNSDGSWKRR